MPEETRQIRYVGGYKYQLREDAWFKTDITPPNDIHTDLVSLYSNGWLHIRKYFAYDGPSGPTLDRSTNMRGALPHDAFYYLMRMELLDRSWKPWVDELFKKHLLEDGAWEVTAIYYHWAVKKFAGYATKNERPIRFAPCELAPPKT